MRQTPTCDALAAGATEDEITSQSVEEAARRAAASGFGNYQAGIQ